MSEQIPIFNKLKPKITLAKCEGNSVGIGVVNCGVQVLVDHYGDKPQHDGKYILCPDCNKSFFDKLRKDNL